MWAAGSPRQAVKTPEAPVWGSHIPGMGASSPQPCEAVAPPAQGASWWDRSRAPASSPQGRWARAAPSAAAPGARHVCVQDGLLRSASQLTGTGRATAFSTRQDSLSDVPLLSLCGFNHLQICVFTQSLQNKNPGAVHSLPGFLKRTGHHPLSPAASKETCYCAHFTDRRVQAWAQGQQKVTSGAGIT